MQLKIKDLVPNRGTSTRSLLVFENQYLVEFSKHRYTNI